MLMSKSIGSAVLLFLLFFSLVNSLMLGPVSFVLEIERSVLGLIPFLILLISVIRYRYSRKISIDKNNFFLLLLLLAYLILSVRMTWAIDYLYIFVFVIPSVLLLLATLDFTEYIFSKRYVIMLNLILIAFFVEIFLFSLHEERLRLSRLDPNSLAKYLYIYILYFACIVVSSNGRINILYYLTMIFACLVALKTLSVGVLLVFVFVCLISYSFNIKYKLSIGNEVVRVIFKVILISILVEQVVSSLFVDIYSFTIIDKFKFLTILDSGYNTILSRIEVYETVGDNAINGNINLTGGGVSLGSITTPHNIFLEFYLVGGLFMLIGFVYLIGKSSLSYLKDYTRKHDLVSYFLLFMFMFHLGLSLIGGEFYSHYLLIALICNKFFNCSLSHVRY